MSPHRTFLVALLTAFVLAAAPAYAEESRPPAAGAEGVAAFLLREDSGARSFVTETSDREALASVARAWAAKTEPARLAKLAAAAAPGSSGERRLVRALSKWTGERRISGPGAVGAFLEDAAAQAEKIPGAASAAGETGDAVAPPDQTKALGRARQLSAQKFGAGVFGPDRSPGGSIGDSRGATGGTGSQSRGAGGSVSGRAGLQANPSVGGNPPGGARPSNVVNPSGEGSAAGMDAASFRPPVPAKFKNAGVVPPLAMVDLNTSDRVINKALSFVNMESYSRKDTLNRESTEGTQAAICRFLIQAKYDPDEAWSKSKAARDAPGADPGDLDLRNAEHYLYAYSTTHKPNGWGDSTPVQLLMAVGWTPFKTVTKHVRSTSTPSLEEAKWGVKGAWHGQHPFDWRGTCEGKKP